MWVVSRAEAACEPFVFRPIDAQGKLAAAVRGAVDGILLELYSNDGLYGETAGEAFDTVVNATINPDSQIAQGQLRAISEVRFSMHAKSILIDLVTVPITGQITA
jgi:phage tail sheath protein FI